MEIFILIIFAAFLAVIAAVDWKTQLIPDKILLPMATTGIFFDLAFSFVPIEAAVFNALLGFLMMFIILKISSNGLGGGDVKFSAVLGLWLGEKLFPAILLGSILAAIFALSKILQTRNLQTKIPFGPFLSIGAFWQAAENYFPLCNF